jgi:branched-chain amino acid transport system substrate-binding protein
VKQLLKFGLGAAFAVAGLAAASIASAQTKEVVIGFQTDRTGPTANIGVPLGNGYNDYVALINSKGGVEGYRVKVVEIDNEYKVPQGVEGYERQKKDGAVLISLFGTPHTQALTARLAEDKIPGTSPGFGSAASADGQRYPYLFPIAASYWSQMAGALQFAKTQLGGSLKGKKIAYIMYDNPAGKEPLPILEDVAKAEGFDFRVFAVPPPGVEMGAQILDLTQRYRPDFVVTHLFGRSPSVSIKELKRSGYPLRKVVAMVWGGAEADIDAAGGYAASEGYNTLQFAGVGGDFPVIREILNMYSQQGKEPPKDMRSSVMYNRGVLIAATHIEAIRNAIKAKGGAAVTGEDVKKGFETISGFSLGGLVPPLKITPQDHEGGGWVKVYQVKGGSLQPVGDWFRAYPDILQKNIQADANRKS